MRNETNLLHRCIFSRFGKPGCLGRPRLLLRARGTHFADHFCPDAKADEPLRSWVKDVDRLEVLHFKAEPELRRRRVNDTI